MAGLFGGGSAKPPKPPPVPRMPVPKTTAELQQLKLQRESLATNRLGRQQTVLGSPTPSS